MAIITSKTRAAAALDDILKEINQPVGAAVGAIQLYTGAAPANVATGPTGTLLATCLLTSSGFAAFGATDTTTLIATGNIAGGNFAEDTNPAAGGTIGYWRLYDWAGVAVLQGTVGTTGIVDITFNTLTVTAGILVAIVTMTVQITGIY